MTYYVSGGTLNLTRVTFWAALCVYVGLDSFISNEGNKQFLFQELGVIKIERKTEYTRQRYTIYVKSKREIYVRVSLE